MPEDHQYVDEFFKSAETQFYKFIKILTQTEIEDICNHTSWYAIKLSSIKNDDEKKIVLQELFKTLSLEVYDCITEYTKVFNFIPKEPDPAKIVYWIVYILYKDGTLKNMSIIRRMLEENIEILRDQLIVKSTITDTQILPKLLMYSGKGHSEFSLVYGEKSLSGYQIYKLIHEAIYIKLPHLKQAS